MYRAVSGVALTGLICLSIGCGPSYWRAQLDQAAALQETSVSGQAAASDMTVKTLWLACNQMTVVYANRVQTVLECRVDEAKGMEGASAALAKAQSAAAAVRPYMDKACALAKDAAAAMAPVVTSPVLVPVAPPVAPPIPSVVLPAPAGGAVPVAPASSPAVSPAVPPVGAVPPPPAPPAMPAAPAVP